MKKLLLALLLIAPGIAQAQSVVVDTDSAAGRPGVVSVTMTNAGSAKTTATVPVRANGTVIDPMQTGASAQNVQGGSASGATDTGNPVKVGGVFNTTPPTLTTGQRGDAQLTARGSQLVSLVDATTNAVTNGVTNADAQAVAAASNYLNSRGFNYIFNGTTWDREKKATNITRIVSAAASTNATSIKASAGDVFRISGYNANAAARYLKLYNKATAPTVGTDTPVWVEYLPPTSRFEFNCPRGYYFTTGIALALTTGSADSDTGALTAADILAFNIVYN